VKPKIDWRARERELLEIAAWAKQARQGPYDCVIGVSGGKDSHFQALYAKEKLGLRTLLVNYYPDDMTAEGLKNLDNLCNQGFDLISIRPNPKVMAACCRKAFYDLLHPVKPTEYPLHVVTCQTAVKFGIPLFIHGENIAFTLGVTGARNPDGNALGCRHNVTVSGGNADDWVQDGITREDLYWYQYPEESALREYLRGIHLDYYAPEFSRHNNMKFAISRGLIGRSEVDPAATGSLTPYTNIDSNMQILSQMLKWYKFGFGYVTDEVCYDIRAGLRTREESIPLVEKYDGRCAPRYIEEFCRYVEISRDEFWRVVGLHTNKKLFAEDKSQGWTPRFKVGVGLVS
jgi:N-acetyl sugar amidotransferase